MGGGDAPPTSRTPQHVKILMVAPEPFLQPRGTPFSILYRMRALVDLGHEIDLLTYPIGRDVELPGVRLHRSPRVLGIRSVPIGPSVRKLLLDVGIHSAAKRLLSRRIYDVLHTHEEAGFFGGRLARRYGVKHVYDMHSQLSAQLGYYRFFRLGLFRSLFETLERRAIRSADVLITISPSLVRVARSIWPEADPVLIENTQEGDDLDPSCDAVELVTAGSSASWESSFSGETDLRARYRLPEDAVLVVYAGSFEPYQGLDLLVGGARLAVAHCPSLRFVFVGGEPRDIDRLQKLVHARGLANHVSFTGRVDPSAIHGHLRQADILVSARSEGTNIPSKIYSYLKAGQAILATSSEAHTQILEPECSLLTPGTSEGLAQGLVTLAQDPALRRRLGDRGKEMADERCSYETYLAATKKAYERLER